MMPFDIMKSMQQGEHLLYESLADNHTFYSAVFYGRSPGEEPLYLYLIPTDSRLSSGVRDIAFNRGIVFRVPESVLKGEMDSDNVRHLLAGQAPRLVDSGVEAEMIVDRAIEQLDTLVENYRPLRKQE